MELASLLKEVWLLMGPKLRKALLGILSASGVIVLVMFAWLFYSTGEMHRRFGILPTKDELQERTDEITNDMATKGDVQEVSYALSNYQDSIARLRAHVDTGLIVPGLNAIVDLQKRMAQFERTGVETRIAIEEQKRMGDIAQRYDAKGEIAFGSQIRSYVMQPYTLVRDERDGIDVKNPAIMKVLDGDLDEFMHAYLRHMTAKRTKAAAKK